MSFKYLKMMSMSLVLALSVGVFSGCSGNSESKAPEKSSAPAATAAADKPAPAPAKPSALRFSTQSLGTSLYVYASTMSQLVTPVLPQGYSIDVQTTSPGGVAAPFLIAEDKAEIALGNAAPAKWGVEGKLLGRPAVKGLTALVGGLDAPYLVVIFTDAFVKKTGIKTMEDLIAKKYPVKIAVKTVGGFGEIACSNVLETFGVSYDTVKSWGGSVTQTSSAQIVDLLRDGKADMTIDHIPGGQASITELSMTSNIHFVQLSDETIKKMNDKGWDSLTMPKNTWKGQESDIKTIGSGVVLLASEKMSEDVAYAITKKLCESKAELAKAYASMEVFDPKTAWEPLKCGAPLHPGAAKYYKEKGYLK